MKEFKKEIETLKNAFMKKQKQTKCDYKNVIYLLTNEYSKEKRIYIIGKTINLKSRLSSYNKSIDHEVVYCKSCVSEEIMSIVENMVLTKMEPYREKANRDRFILPIEKEIDFFINIINDCINFFNQQNIIKQPIEDIKGQSNNELEV
jgi:hypothetical protein